MAPLTKRLPRELKNNLGKYLGIFLLMTLTIALTSGFLLAAHSIAVLINDIPAAYNLEDGRFSTAFEATDKQLAAAADAADDEGGVDIYKNWSLDASLKDGTDEDSKNRILRTYEHRTEIDIAAYAEGAQPAADNEIAIDRVFATNNNLAIGSAITLEGRSFTVVGILTLPDSQALFQDNSSFTVNTLTFGVAEVTEAGFAALQDAGAKLDYNYSFKFKDDSLTLAQRTDIEKDMATALSDADASLDALIDADSNQGISYAAEDVEGDSTMWLVLLYIIIAIMAFVFVVLTSATIEEESAIIGTLLASGYRRGELVAHYMILPMVVGLVSALVGTIGGLTFFSSPMQALYYGSYSLPPYYVSWDWNIFAQTTVVPVAVLVLITLIGLLRKIGHTPLEFLRHETSKGGVKRGFALPERLGFLTRFRLRVFLRNLGNFVTLFIGICFAATLLLFGLAILPTMEHYANNLRNTVVANHEYSLKAPLEIEGTDDERQVWSDIEKLREIDQAKLTEISDEGDALQARADELQAKADDLQARADDLQSRADSLEAQGTALASQAATLQQQGANVQARATALQSQATEQLTAKGAEVQAAAAAAQEAAAKAQEDPTDENVAAAQAAQQAAEQLNAELEALKADFTAQGDKLTAEGNAIKAQGNTLSAQSASLESQGNALTAEGEALSAEKDELEAEGDALEADRDALYEKIDALAAQIGVTRDEFEDMADRIEGIDLDADDLHPVNTTDNGAAKIAQAEKYAVYQLEYDRGEGNGTESITIYGVQENSRYWENLNVGSGRVVFGGGLADKFGFGTDTQVSLYDKYEDKTYDVTCADVWGTKSDMAMYMSIEDFNKLFDNHESYFNAYASDEELQLDSRYVASDLTPSDMDAIGEQFVGMMNDMIGMIVGLAVAISLIFMYLLTKSIIDRSARSISYMKVFGYRDGEVSKLYVRSITWCVVIAVVLCQPLVIGSLTVIFRAMLLAYNGNIEIFVPMTAIAESVAITLAAYAVVAFLHVRNIKKVPLALALKTQE